MFLENGGLHIQAIDTEYIVVAMSFLGAVGAGLAIYERRKKTVLLEHDLSQNPSSSAHLMAEKEHAASQPGLHAGMNMPHNYSACHGAKPGRENLGTH
ncbi:MAG: hypothetical protein JJ897_02960 [Marinibacterium sp.]|nr:hypothetical protein [Marinibacterium sp.]